MDSPPSSAHDHEEIATCPFCGQELLDREAVRRVRESQREFDRRLDAAAAAKAQALAKKLVAKAEADSAKKISALERQIDSERDQVAKLKRKHAEELKNQRVSLIAKAKIDAQRIAELKVKNQVKQLTNTIEKLTEKDDEQKRLIEHLTSEERGEFSQEELILRLKAAFPDDRIERVKRAHTGADILHEVRIGDGLTRAGLIAYECKDTLQWNNSFVDQAKKAGQTHGTPYLVIISRAFPRNEKALCVRDGVVIVHPTRAVDLARVVRRMVEEVNRAALTAEGQAAKSEELYEYLTSTEFRQAFDALGEYTRSLIELLGKERKAHEITWVKRQALYNDLSSKSTAIDARIRTIIEKPLTEELQMVVRLRSRRREEAMT